MAFTQYYVDPAIAGDSGAGTIGDPYGDLQYALNTITRDSTNGDQINIKAGTDEVLGAALSLATYGTPALAAPLVLRGYTSAANDGGIGGISGNGSYSIMAATTYVSFVDLHLHNSGSATIVSPQGGVLYNCEVNNTTGTGIVLNTYAVATYCYVHDCGVSGAVATSSVIYACYFKNGAVRNFTQAISLGIGSLAAFNVISVSGSSSGIANVGRCWTINNTVYSAGGTGSGISGATAYAATIINNVVEGFSGAGGVGINITGTSDPILYGHNKAYNNTTNFTFAPDAHVNLGNNDALGASPFTAPGSDNFEVSTLLKALAFPSAFRDSTTDNFLDVGAAQREEAGTGGAVRILPLIGGLG